MGVVSCSSCLMTEPTPESGVRSRSEGHEADWGVWRGGRTGLVEGAILATRRRGPS